MREIKFRAWNKRGCFMDSAWLIDWEHGMVCHSKHNQSNLDDCVLMQYTGMNDKNGTPIYEGDILRREFEIGHVVYNEATLGFEDYVIEDSGYFIGKVRYRPSEGFVLTNVRKFYDDGEFVEKKSTSIKIYSKYAQVIGNIFEHIHLMEQSE